MMTRDEYILIADVFSEASDLTDAHVAMIIALAKHNERFSYRRFLDLSDADANVQHRVHSVMTHRVEIAYPFDAKDASDAERDHDASEFTVCEYIRRKLADFFALACVDVDVRALNASSYGARIEFTRKRALKYECNTNDASADAFVFMLTLSERA